MAIFAGRSYIDVFWHPTGIGSAYVHGAGAVQTWDLLTITINGVDVVVGSMAPEPIIDPRVAANPAGDYLVVAHGQATDALMIYDSTTGLWTTDGVVFGQRANAVGWNGTNFLILAQASGTTWRRITFGVGQTTEPIGFSTSQGVLQYFPGATVGADDIRWTDPNRTLVVGGITLTLPVYANGVWAGQFNTQSVAVLADGSRSLVEGEEGQDIRIAFANGIWATASWLLNERNFLTLSPPWPSLTPGTGGGGAAPGGGGIPGGPPFAERNTARARVTTGPRTRQYHETDQIPDPFTQRMARLIWDQLYSGLDRIDEAVTRIGALEADRDTLRTDVDRVRLDVLSTMEASAKIVSSSPSGGPIGGPTEPPSTTDALDAVAGCAAAGGTGHLTDEQRRLAPGIKAGLIVCGTGQEFAALRAPTADLPTRLANASQLIGRIVWHIQLAGAAAGRQRNPSGAISDDKVTVNLNGVWRAFDVFVGLDDFASTMAMAMQETFPADTVPDAGIPD